MTEDHNCRQLTGCVWDYKKTTTIVETPWLMCQLTNQDRGREKNIVLRNRRGAKLAAELSKHGPPQRSF